MSYPNRPNAVTKKKYYEFIQNLPIFIPVESISTDVGNLINEYPVLPYLENRESLVRWMWFIHNKINQKLEKPQITLNEFYIQYYEAYKPNDVKMKEYNKVKEKVIYGSILITMLGSIYYLYDK